MFSNLVGLHLTHILTLLSFLLFAETRKLMHEQVFMAVFTEEFFILVMFIGSSRLSEAVNYCG